MDTNFQLMEDYLKGKLDQEGKQLFDSKLKNEPEFETAFREMKAIQDGAKLSAKLSTLKQLEKIEASIQSQETTKIEFNMKKLVSVAASLILIATVSYLTVFNTPDVATGQELFDEHYRTYENRITGVQRGETIDLSTLKNRAFNAYDNRNFGEAVNLFEELIEGEKSAEAYLYSGISNLEFGNLETAKEQFNTVGNYFEEFKAQSSWFLAMTLLKENTEESTDEAVYSLADLALGKSTYKEKAMNVLSELGLSIANDGGDVGNTVTVYEIPEEEEDNTPNGSLDFMGRRQVQFGIIASGGQRFRFFTDRPIDGLEEGDEVLFVALRSTRKGKSRRIGYAFILDKI